MKCKKCDKVIEDFMGQICVCSGCGEVFSKKKSEGTFAEKLAYLVIKADSITISTKENEFSIIHPVFVELGNNIDEPEFRSLGEVVSFYYDLVKEYEDKNANKNSQV